MTTERMDHAVPSQSSVEVKTNAKGEATITVKVYDPFVATNVDRDRGATKRDAEATALIAADTLLTVQHYLVRNGGTVAGMTRDEVENAYWAREKALRGVQGGESNGRQCTACNEYMHPDHVAIRQADGTYMHTDCDAPEFRVQGAPCIVCGGTLTHNEKCYARKYPAPATS